MKRLLLPLLALSIPAAHATNYVECEAIRAVITRNNIQLENAVNNSYQSFRTKLINEKFKVNSYSEIDRELDFVRNIDCKAFADKIPNTQSEEYELFFTELTKPYFDIEDRATNDFKKRGCYYF